MAKKRSLKYCVEGFLELVISEPEKMPKQEYRCREIHAEMRGFNKAQEHLRGILELNGTDAAAALSEIREDGQMRPERHGKFNLWMVS